MIIEENIKWSITDIVKFDSKEIKIPELMRDNILQSHLIYTKLQTKLNKYFSINGFNYTYIINYFLYANSKYLSSEGLDRILPYFAILDENIKENTIMTIRSLNDTFKKCAEIVCEKKGFLGSTPVGSGFGGERQVHFARGVERSSDKKRRSQGSAQGRGGGRRCDR